MRNQRGQFQKVRHKSWMLSTWNDGFLDSRGYFHVYLPEHPKATPSGWIKRGHAVLWLIISQVLPDGMALHHVNGNKLDDSFNNLLVADHREHTRNHCTKLGIERICQWCKQLFRIKQWRLNEGVTRGTFCSQQCYHNAGGRWYK